MKNWSTMKMDAPRAYRAPALERGLDILECLASAPAALSQAAIARSLGRGSSEIFRMLERLRERGYVSRDPESGLYSLTLRLLELGRAQSPYRVLIDAARAPMARFTAATGESCHLAVLQAGSLLTLAQMENSRPVRLSVEAGARFEPLRTASGRLLIALLPAAQRGEWKPGIAAIRRLNQIAKRGYEEAWSESVRGVHDLAVPLPARGSGVHAALATARLASSPRGKGPLLDKLHACAREISWAAGIQP